MFQHLLHIASSRWVWDQLCFMCCFNNYKRWVINLWFWLIYLRMYHIHQRGDDIQISQSQKCDPTDTDEMWKMNFYYHTFWIMWHQGQDVKSHFLKNSPHAFHHKDFMLVFICREENGVTDVNQLDCHFFSCGGEINPDKLLFNVFIYTWQTIIVSLKFKFRGNLPPYLFKNRLITLLWNMQNRYLSKWSISLVITWLCVSPLYQICIPVGVLHLLNLDIHNPYDHLVPLKQNVS